MGTAGQEVVRVAHHPVYDVDRGAAGGGHESERGCGGLAPTGVGREQPGAEGFARGGQFPLRDRREVPSENDHVGVHHLGYVRPATAIVHSMLSTRLYNPLIFYRHYNTHTY